MDVSKLKTRVLDIFLLTTLTLLMTLPGLARLPALDRDEARYAQATVQMLETGDYVNIRFQDAARNKKPVGAYWAQAVSVKLFSDMNNRHIRAHRLPSILGALLAVLATYWGGCRMLGRQAAIIGAALLATCMILVFEAHIAKTDALLTGFGTLALAALAALRSGGGRGAALLLWVALGCAVLVKGPVLPLILLLTFAGLLIWERKIDWLKPLAFWPGPLVFFVIVLPWTVLIWRETGGAFFTDAASGDLVPKLKGGHERHGGLPGYYTLLIWGTFWPGCLFLLPGLAFAVRAARGKNEFEAPVAKSARLLLCWSLPFFFLLELVPTKLPHYPLPALPSFALMAAVAITAMSGPGTFRLTRRIGAAVFMPLSIGLCAGLLFAERLYGGPPTWSFPVLGAVVLISLYAGIRLWSGKSRSALVAVLITAVLANVTAYQWILPALDELFVSRNIEEVLKSRGIKTPLESSTRMASPHFTEPSLVYRLGTHIKLGVPDKQLVDPGLGPGDLLLLDQAREDGAAYAQKMRNTLAAAGLCTESLDTVSGTNYARGDPVRVEIMKIISCPKPVMETGEGSHN